MAPNYAGPFVRVGRLFAPRYRQASLYTLSDTPMFTCIKKDVAGILNDLA